MLIIYTKSCLACTNKALWKRVQKYALTHNLTLQERRIGLNKSWAADAERIGVELPFIVYGSNSVNLHEKFEELL